MAPAGVVVHFTTIPGRTYWVQFKQGLLDPAWSNLGNSLVAAGTETAFTDSLPLGVNQRFYRVIQAP
jgi:hypothetical protein